MSNDTLKRTGRTSRMIEEGKRLAKEGRSVYLIFHSMEQAEREAASRGMDKNGYDEYGLRFETAESAGNLDWMTMHLRGSHANCIVLVDHYAIERRFDLVLDMLHRFDDSPNLHRTPDQHSEAQQDHDQAADAAGDGV